MTHWFCWPKKSPLRPNWTGPFVLLDAAFHAELVEIGRAHGVTVR